MCTQPKELLIEKYIKPSQIEKFNNDVVIKYWFNKYGEPESINGQPAGIRYKKGKIELKVWGKNNTHHRDKNLPAKIYYMEDEKIKLEEWYKNGKLIKVKHY